MEINNKYKVGDYLYYLQNGKIEKMRIDAVEYLVAEDGISETPMRCVWSEYGRRTYNKISDYTKSELYQSKADLIKDLIDNAMEK